MSRPLLSTLAHSHLSRTQNQNLDHHSDTRTPLRLLIKTLDIMPYTVIIFAYRKPGVSPAAFKSHYEFSHIPLVHSITGSLFPKSHTRRYIQRAEADDAEEDAHNNDYPATVLVGSQADFEYDAFAEVVFDDQAAFQAFFARVSEAGPAERIAKDEDMFLDRAKTKAVVVDDCNVTSRPTTSG